MTWRTGWADFHSHLVPGVDDGASWVDESLDGVGRMVRAEITQIITTPHFDASLTRQPGRFRERMALMDERWSQVSRAVKHVHPDLDFRRGHEIMLDVPDPDLTEPRLRLGGTSYVLVEWPRLHLPPGTVEVISRLRGTGVRPIVAHPERYVGVDPQLSLIEHWRKAGALLQINHGSLVGRYGASAKNLAFRLIERGLADYLSTDFHGKPHLKLYINEAREVFESLGGEEQFAMMAGTNPSRLFQDQEPLPIPPLKINRGFLGRLRSLLTGQGTR